jgi:hypothetical protein
MGTLTGASFFEELAEGAIEYARLSLTRLVYFFLEGRQIFTRKRGSKRGCGL